MALCLQGGGAPLLPPPESMTRHEQLLVQLCPLLNPVLAHSILARLSLPQLLTLSLESLQVITIPSMVVSLLFSPPYILLLFFFAKIVFFLHPNFSLILQKISLLYLSQLLKIIIFIL